MQELHYFLSGNTSRGKIDYTFDAMKRMNQLYLIDGPFTENNHIILEYAWNELKEFVDKLEVVHYPSDPLKLHALFLAEHKIGIINSAPPLAYDKEIFEGSLVLLNMYDNYHLDVIEKNKHQLDSLTTSIHNAHLKAYAHYNRAINIHDEWEKIYINRMDFAAASKIANQLADTLLPAKTDATDANSNKHSQLIRFLGAATPIGAVDYVPNLTQGLKRYLIKGRPGSGKSTMLRTILETAKKQGYEIEVYHCGLDPNSLDMIICRELGFAIFDSTAPHEYFPEHETDVVIDMYELCIEPNTDEIYSEQIAEIFKRYQNEMSLAKQALADAKQYQDQRAKLTSVAMMLPQFNQAKINLVRQIKNSIK